jgi:hypothetical protein
MLGFQEGIIEPSVLLTGNCSGARVWAILGLSSANELVIMAILEGYLCGTRVE